jgi:hypothetical protein
MRRVHRFRRHGTDRVGASWRAAALAVPLVALAGCSGAPTVTTPPSLSAPSSSAPSSEEAVPSGAPADTAAGTGGGAAARPGGPAPCHSGTLAVSLGASEGAAGTIYVSLRFTDKGSAPCVIQGFPGVSYVGGDKGVQVGPAAEREGTKGAPVTLAPGAVASAPVGMVQVLNYDEAVCRPTPTRGIRVYPPGDTASVFVPLSGTGCAGNPPGPQLTVGTIVAGPGQS